MKYWLVSAPIHGTDIQPSYVGRAWPYEKVTPDERLKGQEIPDLYIFELDVPRGSPAQLYAAASHVVWMKTDAGKQRLTHDQVVAEVLRRKDYNQQQSRLVPGTCQAKRSCHRR